jgi:outer membrane protein
LVSFLSQDGGFLSPSRFFAVTVKVGRRFRCYSRDFDNSSHALKIITTPSGTEAQTVSAKTFSLRGVKAQTVRVLCVVILLAGINQANCSAADNSAAQSGVAANPPSDSLPPFHTSHQGNIPQDAPDSSKPVSFEAASIPNQNTVVPATSWPSAPLPPSNPAFENTASRDNQNPTQTIAPGANDHSQQNVVVPPPSAEIPQQEIHRDCPEWACGDFSREPADFHPWWEEGAMHPLNASIPPLQMQLESVVLGTLACSPQIKVMREVAPIREDAIVEAQGDFDPKAFVETKFLDTSDPVGSVLTTGGPDRYIDQNWNYSTGLRKRTLTGAQIELSQKIGYEDSNSLYFLPALQGSSRLSLNITQPLLNGAGQAYNSRLIVLAQIDAQSARDSVSKDLQTLLLEVYQAYWDLHLQRALLLQKRRLYERGVDVCQKLEGRKEIDAVGGQLARAKAAVASRYGSMIRQETDLLNADAKLRTLMNDPYLLANRGQELIPMQMPLRTALPLTFEDSLVVALYHRPEINQARTELKAAAIRQDVAKNELRPVLNLILSTYVSGLEGDVNIGKAMNDQFTQGRPTYSTGVTFEVPLGNRTARSKFDRRRLEIIQLTSQLVAATSNVRLEVEKAVREIKTTYREMLCQAHAIMGNLSEIDYLNARWEASLDEQRSSAVLLDDLLNAHDRLARSEGLYATALVAYNAGFAHLNRATGTLLDCQSMRGAEYARNQASASSEPQTAVDYAQPASDPKTATNPNAQQRR